MTEYEASLDKKGKDLFASLMKQLQCSYSFTPGEFDRVDVYFGRSNVGEIKYRLQYYKTFIIEEDKLDALSSVPVSNQYYITVLPKNIYFWSVPTIRTYLPSVKQLPINPERTLYRAKVIRYLPTEAADFHYQLQNDNVWKLIKIN